MKVIWAALLAIFITSSYCASADEYAWRDEKEIDTGAYEYLELRLPNYPDCFSEAAIALKDSIVTYKELEKIDDCIYSSSKARRQAQGQRRKEAVINKLKVLVEKRREDETD